MHPEEPAAPRTQGSPELLLTGQPLIDQGRVVTVMVKSGWGREQLLHVIADRFLPHVRTTVSAIIAARLRAAQAFRRPPLQQAIPSCPPATTRRHGLSAPHPRARWGRP